MQLHARRVLECAGGTDLRQQKLRLRKVGSQSNRLLQIGDGLLRSSTGLRPGRQIQKDRIARVLGQKLLILDDQRISVIVPSSKERILIRLRSDLPPDCALAARYRKTGLRGCLARSCSYSTISAFRL